MKGVERADSVTDCNLGIVYGLLLADVKWSPSGSINYKSATLSVMHAFLALEVKSSHWNLTLGDWTSGSHTVRTRPSSFMADYFLAFANVDTANTTKWNIVYNTASGSVHGQFAHGSGTGIVPEVMVWSATSALRTGIGNLSRNQP